MDVKSDLKSKLNVYHLSTGLVKCGTCKGRICCPLLTSASAIRGRIFGFQAFFEAAKQNPIAFVLLILPGMELALDLEAPVHHKG